MSRNVLVTGGAGFIGSHACKALAQAGYSPVAFDNLTRGHRVAVKWGPLEVGDICDRNRLNDVFERHRPIAVMHFAALAYVGESVQKPQDYYRNNVTGTLTLLEAMIGYGISQMVFSSSCATYGVPSKIPITEDNPLQPISPYGFTKMTVERMLSDFQLAHGLRFVSLRYFNASGADPAGEIGENHNPETHVIPAILHAACGKIQHFDIYGNNYNTADGTCVRDFIHVSDLATAHLLALNYLEKQGVSTYLNLGNGKGFSVMQLIEKAKDITRKHIPYIIADRRPGDPATLVADSSKATSILGWIPAIPDVATHIEHSWKWMTRGQAAQ
jgi:UDP-arabinose 4-epimerase